MTLGIPGLSQHMLWWNSGKRFRQDKDEDLKKYHCFKGPGNNNYAVIVFLATA
jgi:hypothetical protein